jgi:hypothetical protein
MQTCVVSALTVNCVHICALRLGLRRDVHTSQDNHFL